MDDLTALSDTAGRSKRRLEEAMDTEASSDLLMPTPYHQELTSLQGPGTSGSGLVSSYGMGNTSPGTAYVPGYEWWPPLAGPGISQPYQSDASAYSSDPMVSSYTGMPNSLFTFDPTHLSTDFMQGVPQGPSAMQHYPQHSNQQHPSQQHPSQQHPPSR